jgi:SAM-dependent methyltransferase
MIDAITIDEMAKYQRVWSEIPEYGKFSPAMRVVDKVVKICNGLDVKTVLDAGCGCGRAMKRFKDLGFDVTGVDIVDNCIDEDIREELKPNFIQSSLWELQIDRNYYDMVFCVDVMEHIPPDRVYKVLTKLTMACKKYAYFKIAKFQDGYGKRINEPLHLSLYSTEQWKNLLSKHFNEIEVIIDGSNYSTFFCEKGSCKSCQNR